MILSLVLIRKLITKIYTLSVQHTSVTIYDALHLVYSHSALHCTASHHIYNASSLSMELWVPFLTVP